MWRMSGTCRRPPSESALTDPSPEGSAQVPAHEIKSGLNQASREQPLTHHNATCDEAQSGRDAADVRRLPFQGNEVSRCGEVLGELSHKWRVGWKGSSSPGDEAAADKETERKSSGLICWYLTADTSFCSSLKHFHPPQFGVRFLRLTPSSSEGKLLKFSIIMVMACGRCTLLKEACAHRYAHEL